MIHSRNDPITYIHSATMSTKTGTSKSEDVSNACIIRFEIPELNENRVEAKFGEGDESVKEYFNVYQEGD